MSVGGAKSKFINDVVKRAIDNGITVVAAAGNDGRDACNYTPGNIDATITVGSSSRDDEVSYFSNVGQCVDLFAPVSSR